MSGTEEMWQEEMVAPRYYVGIKQVWRTGGGAGLGCLSLRGSGACTGPVVENRCRECCPGMAQLGSYQWETPQSEWPEPAGGRPLSFYRHSGNGAEKNVCGASPRVASVHLLFPGRTQHLQEANGKQQGWGRGWDEFSLP